MISGKGLGAAYVGSSYRGFDLKDPQSYQDRIKKNKDDALAKQDLEKQRKAKKDKDFEDSLKLNDKDFVAKISTIDSMDDVVRDFANSSREQYLELGRKAIEAQKSGNSRDQNILLNRMAKIKGNFKNANTFQDSLLSKVQEYGKLNKEGKLSPADSEYASMMTAVAEKNFTIDNDENGIPHINGLLKNPITGKEGKKTLRLSDFATKYRPVTPYDVDSWIKDEASKSGLTTTSDASGLYINSTEGLSEQGRVGIESTIAAATAGDEYMTDLLYKATGGKEEKREGFTEEDRETVRKWMRERALGQFGVKETKKVNSAVQKSLDRSLKKKELKSKEPQYSFEAVEDVKGNVQGEQTASASDLNTQQYTVTEKTTGRGMVGVATDNPKTELTGFTSEFNNRTGDVSIRGNFRTPSKGGSDSAFGDGGSGDFKIQDRNLNNEEITRFMDILRSRDDEQSKSMLNELGKALNRNKTRDNDDFNFLSSKESSTFVSKKTGKPKRKF